MPASDPPVLELRGLRKSFGDTKAVAEVSATFAPGEYACVLGPSGCGKTTLLRLIAGFEEPSAGTILLDGRSLSGVPPDRRDVNVVFQSYALFPHLSVYDNVAFGPRMRRRPAPEVEASTAEALRLVRMEALVERRPAQLSGGQQQRVALARAVVNRPRVLLLDEPLSALDRRLRLEMQEELRTVQARTGITFLHITHDQSEALALADRLVVMRAGRFVQQGTPAEVYDRPVSPFVADFLGSANLLEATLEDDGAVTLGGTLRLRPADVGLPAGPVVVSLRAEALLVEREGGPAPNRLRGTIRRITAAGPVLACTVDIDGLTLVAHLAGRARGAGLRAGERVWVEAPPEAVVLLPVDAAG